MASGEFDYIRWLRDRIPATPGVLVGPGDDCAVLAPRPGATLVTTDMLMDGVDFRLGEVDPARIGRKAMAVNLSDIAAMAGIPRAAVVALALPKSGGRALGEQLFLGLREMADRYETAIVGGDTNSWDGPLVISITVLGEATAKGAVTRAGAKPGDWLLVTGPLGGSLLGHHLDFMPRIREALALHAECDLHAMIDLSDGLSSDAVHLAEESQCGLDLDAASIPISAAARAAAKSSGRTPLDHALNDGEDFELLFAVSPAEGQSLLQEQPIAGVTLFKVGECTDHGLWLRTESGRTPLTASGWVHELQ